MDKKTLIGGIVGVLLLGGVVGSVVALTKGVTNTQNTEEKEEKSTRQNIRKYDFKGISSGKMEVGGNQDLISYMNSCDTGDFTFKSVIQNNDSTFKLSNVYKDKELGLRLGTDEELGFFDVSLVDDYKFNHIQITCVNYGRKRGDIPNVYNKQDTNSRFKVNGSSEIKLLVDEDLSIPYQPITCSLSFETLQDHLEFVGIEGRPCILGVEMWVI